MKGFISFLLLSILLLANFGSEPMIVEATKTCHIFLEYLPGCTVDECTHICSNNYGVSAVGRCVDNVECHCDHPC
ncbi:Uncharacterized protein TCM_022502 [Theobroma cacao]|uniref:Uncharacterized protein n=1 Tax=Theobroma cacao TaxID=3641 RepID=A0A061EUY3_THECC|nr:Uncharacterized protein TCM_022502 [Theobroma cacao]